MSDDMTTPERDLDASPPKRSALFVLKRTVREFVDDGSTDPAAALTYFSVLSIFPGLLVLLSLVGLVGQADESVEKIKEILAPLVSPERLDSITGILNGLVDVEGAGVALVVGVVGALWSASGYVGAFSRVDEQDLRGRRGPAVLARCGPCS